MTTLGKDGNTDKDGVRGLGKDVGLEALDWRRVAGNASEGV